MKISKIEIHGIRCFKAEQITLDQKCNIFVGRNNVGKSTILKVALSLQGAGLDNNDRRIDYLDSSFFRVEMIGTSFPLNNLGIPPGQKAANFLFHMGGPAPSRPATMVSLSQPVFRAQRPHNVIVPFLARRMATTFDETITLGTQEKVTGNHSNLYSRIDGIATAGAPNHDLFRKAMSDILGLPITTKASGSGKVAGMYLGREFVPIDRMGDGVTEMAALVVDLCTETNKIFVLEEPETHLHPQGLKALLEMIRQSAEHNQFLIATHSNIVVRELGSKLQGRVFRVFQELGQVIPSSHIEQLESDPQAHLNLLRELGHEFGDLNLFDGWLLLEESSAEQVFNQVLIPIFTPSLKGRLRTYSAGGAGNVEPSLSELMRMVVFVHLEPVYKDQIWVRVDGDQAGIEAITKIKTKFPQLKDEQVKTFSNGSFEKYYPDEFANEVEQVLALENAAERRNAKTALLRKVLDWTKANPEISQKSWYAAAKECVALLKAVEAKLLTR